VLDVERQRQPRSDESDQAEVVRVTADLVAGVVAWPTQRAALFLAAAGSRSIDGQSDEAGVVEGLVALGLSQECDRGEAGRLRVEPLREVAERVVAEGTGQPGITPARAAGQSLDGMVGSLPQHVADQVGPEQDARGDLRLGATITAVIKVPLADASGGEGLEPTGGQGRHR
jgi:hypothetical protein